MQVAISINNYSRFEVDADGFNVSDPNSIFYRHKVGAVYPLQQGHGFLIGRKPVVLRTYWPDIEETPEKREDYFRRLLMLFLPWRGDNELNNEGATFEATFTACKEQLRMDMVDLYL
jgi:hypothetical protein